MRRVVIISCLLLVITACRSQEPIEPTPTPKPTATTSSAADPDIKAPTLPAQARKNTAEGAASFVGYWVQTLNFASRTGDTRQLRRISDEDCGGCTSYAELFEKTYADGGFFRDSDWSIRKLKIKQGGSEHLILARVTAPPGTYRKSAGQPVRNGTREDSRLAFTLKFDGGWSMTQFGLESELQ